MDTDPSAITVDSDVALAGSLSVVEAAGDSADSISITAPTFTVTAVDGYTSQVTYELSLATESDDSGLMTTIGNYPITLVVSEDGQTVTGVYTDGDDIEQTAFTVSLDGTTITLNSEVALEHSNAPQGEGEDNTLDLNGLIEVTATISVLDGDLDPVETTSSSSTLNIEFVDTDPVYINPTTGHLIDLATAPDLVESLNFVSGEDGVGSYSFTTIYDGTTLATDGSGNTLSFEGAPLYLYTSDDGTTIIASTVFDDPLAVSPEAATTGYYITLNDDGTYTFHSNGVIENGTAVTATDLSGVGGGNVNFKGLYGEIDTPQAQGKFALAGTDEDVVASTADGFTVNSNASEIGIGQGNSINSSEGIRFDFVNELEITKVGNDFTLSYDGTHNLTNSYRQQITSVNNGSGGVAHLSLTAIIADGDDVFYGDNDEATVDLSAENIKVYDQNGVLLSQVVDYSATVEADYTVLINDGVAYLSGLEQGWTFEIVTEGESNQFSAVQIDGEVDTAEFKLGFFSYGTDGNGEPIDLSYDVTATDGDGDSVSGSLDVVLYPDGSTLADELVGNGDDLDGTDLTDYILAYDGNDTLQGFGGDDILIGGLGNDLMEGGTGSDTFVFSLAEDSGLDTITDFEVGTDVLAFEDVIDANENSAIDLGDAIESYVNGGDTGDLILNLTNGGTVVLEGAGTGAVDSNIDLATYLAPTIQSDQS